MSRPGTSRADDERVLAILAALRRGEAPEEIGERYGITANAVREKRRLFLKGEKA